MVVLVQLLFPFVFSSNKNSVKFLLSVKKYINYEIDGILIIFFKKQILQDHVQ